MHGFPYDPRCYDEVVPPLVASGYRTIVPYLRGYGETAFLSPSTPRSGEQAALGQDLLDLMDALGFSRAALVGFDWGGRAACIVAALWPRRHPGALFHRALSAPDDPPRRSRRAAGSPAGNGRRGARAVAPHVTTEVNLRMELNPSVG
jgi:pimeloyl-ACP methyl ester carboxylesterase